MFAPSYKQILKYVSKNIKHELAYLLRRKSEF